jgi:GWxTD domain-containing protein
MVRASWVIVFCLTLLLQSRAAQKLPPAFANWLNHDVAYIITSEEKQAFLALSTDDEREKFIERFWELRNPTPGAPTNPYREEHYRRLAYVEQYFGTGHNDGWRTDRGQIYITLGAPQQKAYYRETRNVRPMEIWFYQAAHPALPPFFSIVYYKRDAGDDYRLYSPYADGPAKLVNTLRAGNTTEGALPLIQDSLGEEVARTTLSLLPDEPVDLQHPQPSLQSDVMLSTIKALANNPLTKEELRNRRRMLEAVSHRIILGDEFADFSSAPLRDSSGGLSLHYLVRLKRPDDLSMAQDKDKYYYSLAFQVRVLTSLGKLIYSQEKDFSRYLDQAQFQDRKSRPFGIEGSLPLAPGPYKLEFVLTNKLSHVAYKMQKDVVVPRPVSEGIAISELVPFSAADAAPDRAGWLPFSSGGVKFTPIGTQDLSYVPGQDIKFFYQIWEPPADPSSNQNKKLDVDYAYGSLSMHVEPKTIHEDVARDQFDPSGTMLNGKKISTVDLPPGNYRLSVTVTDPETQKKAYGVMGFRLTNLGATPPCWTDYDQDAPEEARHGIPEYQRGLSYVAQGDTNSAQLWFRKSLDRDAANEPARTRVVESLFGQKAYAQIPPLFAKVGVTPQTNELTILQVAESMAKLGDNNRAIALLESALSIKIPSAPLFLSLADYYQRAGNTQKAAESRRKGEAIASPTS